MQPLSFTEHLAAAAADGITLPSFSQGGGVLHYWDCEDTWHKNPVEPGHHSLSLLNVGECSNCWNDAQQTDAGIGDVVALMNLQAVALQAPYLRARTSELEDPQHLADLLNQGRNYDDWLETFVNTASELRRRGLDGLCSLQGNAADELETPAQWTPLRAYVFEQAAALAEEWHTLTARGLLRQHLLAHRANKVPRGAFSSRARQTTQAVQVVEANALGHLLDPSDGTTEFESMALIAESTALAAHANWEVIAWDTRLDKWAPTRSVAFGEYSTDELELALSMFSHDGASLQQLLDAVRAAQHA